ncbi:MAG: helix-turn-helix domain-containing protein [Halosimplex sp.]
MRVYADVSVSATDSPFEASTRAYPDVTVEVERVVPTGGPSYYAWFVGEGHRALLDDLRRDDSVGEVVVLDELPDRTLVRLGPDWLSPPLFDAVAAVGVTVVELRGTHDGWTAQLRFPDAGALGAFYDAAVERDLPVEFRQIYESDVGSRGASGTEYEVTETQRETLAAAYERGYFEVPRRITLTELADRLGVSEQAVSERIRRGLASLLTATLSGDESEPDPGDSPE